MQSPRPAKGGYVGVAGMDGVAGEVGVVGTSTGPVTGGTSPTHWTVTATFAVDPPLSV